MFMKSKNMKFIQFQLDILNELANEKWNCS